MGMKGFLYMSAKTSILVCTYHIIDTLKNKLATENGIKFVKTKYLHFLAFQERDATQSVAQTKE